MIEKRTMIVVAAFVATVGVHAIALQSATAACTGSVQVTSCTQTCTSNCYLLNDISCTSGQGITLSSGADLDMCGHHLYCSSVNCTGKAAVTMTSSNSIVNNSFGTGPESKIYGPWFTGVNCAGQTGSKVIGIKFDTLYGGGVSDCAKVQNNTFIDNGLPGVVIHGIANTDEISDNYFQGYRGIFVDNDFFKVSVHHNLFANYANAMIFDDPFHAYEVTDNIIMDANVTPIDDTTASGFGTFAHNYCDPANSNCTTCVSNGQCQAPTALFNLP